MTNLLLPRRHEHSDTRTTDQVEPTFIFTCRSAKACHDMNAEVEK